MQSPSSPPPGSGGGVSYAPAQQPATQPQQSGQGFPYQGQGPDPNMPLSDSLRAALDGTGPGYQQGQPGQQAQPGQQGQPAQQPQTPAEWAALRTALGKFGVNIPEGITPEQGYMTIAQAVQGHQQGNMYAQLGQTVAGEWDQYQQWRQQAQPQQPAQQEPLWNPPQFDPRWMDAVETDPQTGRIRSKFGQDPRYGTMVQAYADYMEGEQKRFWQDPGQYMWRHLEPLVQQAMQGTVQSSFGQYQEQVAANNVLQQHQGWLYQKDQNNRPVRAANGKMLLTPNGVRYFQYLQEATEQHGIQGTDAQNRYALKMLENDALRAKLSQFEQGQQQGQQGQPQGMQFAAQQGGQQQNRPFIPAGANHQPNVNGLQQMTPAHRQGVQPTVEEPAEGVSLYQMMRQGFSADGVTDQDIRSDMARRQSDGY